jgi:hypothetical protein
LFADLLHTQRPLAVEVFGNDGRGLFGKSFVLMVKYT